MKTVPSRDARADVLRRFGATDAVVEEVLRYTANPFDLSEAPPVSALPLGDEPFVRDWERYRDRAREEGAARVLRDVLVELRFPIERGVHATDAYRRATRSLHHTGADSSLPSGGVVIEDPGGLSITLHATPAGRVPVVTVADRGDFERVLQALARRNEPEPIRDSIGAMMLSGYRNWERIHRLKKRWKQAQAETPSPSHPAEADSGGERAAWTAVFRAADPADYLDRFVLCSTGPYSGVEAAVVGADAATWTDVSAQIRIAHEATHYATRRLFGSMRNALYDELMADYFGLVHATGRFRSDWFLAFMGVDERGRAAASGRVHHYRGDPPLSDAAFAVVNRLLHAAARNVGAVDAWAAAFRDAPAFSASLLLAFAQFTLEDLAAPSGGHRLRAAVRAIGGKC